ncbi:acetylornithine deacetylase [Dokdonella sp.]|uniref:acetylornithine deacetylase n=1 Tax=Dokdonella sp. TaxID=2291710 RepID=UPI0027B8FB36|nr:acetylornithine deacetylase [Dokdonella sp.]
MNDLLTATIRHLRALVGFDTRNPPRAIDTGGIFDYLRAELGGFDLDLRDHGAGAVSLLARRGQPRILFNVHLDTVPDSPHWSASPFALRVDGERAVGLGACDIKGAAAALLAAAQASNGDAAFLFTSDEEANDARCIAAFLREPCRFDAVVVAEPTRGEAVLAHRGIGSLLLRFAGRAGHASGEQQAADSALHQAVRWGARALDHVASLAGEAFGGLRGLRFNIGRIEGGIKANVIAPTAELRCGFRPLPSMGHDDVLAALRACADVAPVEFSETFRGAPLPAGDPAHAEARRLAAQRLAMQWQLPIGPAVDFWTEAALFSQAGCTALVYGPGNIAQAHSADEWVALEQLDRAVHTYHRLLEITP